MNWVDIAIIVYLAVSVLGGLMSGLIRSVLSLVGLVVGIVLASNFYQELAGLLTFIHSENIANIVAFIIILGIVMIVAGIVGGVLRRILNVIKLGFIDKLGGAAFGLLMGVLSAGAFLALVIKLTGTALIADSSMARFLLDSFPVVMSFLPSEFDIIRDFFK